MNDTQTIADWRNRAANARGIARDFITAQWADAIADSLEAARDERERAAEYLTLERHGHDQ